jgi:endonuclease-3
VAQKKKSSPRSRRPRAAPAAPKRPTATLVDLAPAPVAPDEAARAREVVARLRRAYPDARVMLNFRDPWQLLVATILAAQCTDAKVNEVTPGLFARFGTPEKLAKANQRTLQSLVRPTGFFRAKSRSIKEASRLIVERFGGEVPATMAELLTLPGLGRKTANVILGSAFGRPNGVVVDTHNVRLSNALGFVATTDPIRIEQFWIGALAKKDWTACGHLLYFHGQRVCVARRPRHDECILRDLCPSSGG